MCGYSISGENDNDESIVTQLDGGLSDHMILICKLALYFRWSRTRHANEKEKDKS